MQFFEVGNLPEASCLGIEVWDKDLVTPDDVMGTTSWVFVPQQVGAQQPAAVWCEEAAARHTRFGPIWARCCLLRAPLWGAYSHAGWCMLPQQPVRQVAQQLGVLNKPEPAYTRTDIGPWLCCAAAAAGAAAREAGGATRWQGGPATAAAAAAPAQDSQVGGVVRPRGATLGNRLRFHKVFWDKWAWQ